MTTYKELVYYCLDNLKLISDDSHFTEEHVLFLLDKYRGLILKQRYSDIRKEIPESNYQTLCINVELTDAIDGSPCTGGQYLKSVEELPHTMSIGTQKITSEDFFQGDIALINNERFKYVGNNKYLQNQIYGTIAPDSHLYLKSSNPQFRYLEKVKVTGIFEDSAKASELQCDENEEQCDVMERNYPLEEALVPPVLELVLKDLGGAKYQSVDNSNNANDDLSDIAAWMRAQLAQGRKSDLYKEY